MPTPASKSSTGQPPGQPPGINAQSGQHSRLSRWLAANGALCAAAAVALSAYAAHAAEGTAQSRLQTAAIMAFGHGLALAVLAPARFAPARLAAAVNRGLMLSRLALCALYLGVLLFSGSIVFNVLAQWPTTLAPLGGMLLIGGWLVLAIDFARG